MKKTLIALAAVAATGAFAQSSVTLYGTIDASVVSVSKHTATKDLTAYNDGAVSSSIWGLKGSEDLGGGMKANFQLEGDIQSNNGQSNQNGIFRRGARAGLSGGFGSVDLGVSTNLIIATHGTLYAMGGNSVSTNNASSLGFADFYTKNSITYKTPAIGGFTLGLQVGMGNDPDGASDGAVQSYSLTYANGPLMAALAGQQRTGGGTAASANGTSVGKTSSVIGGTYKATNDLTLSVVAARTQTEAAVEKSMTGFGAAYALNKQTSVGGNMLSAHGSALTNLQVRHALSSRTSLYGQYQVARNGTDGTVNYAPVASNTGNANNTIVDPAYTGITNTTQSSMSVGIIHSF